MRAPESRKKIRLRQIERPGRRMTEEIAGGALGVEERGGTAPHGGPVHTIPTSTLSLEAAAVEETSPLSLCTASNHWNMILSKPKLAGKVVHAGSLSWGAHKAMIFPLAISAAHLPFVSTDGTTNGPSVTKQYRP